MINYVQSTKPQIDNSFRRATHLVLHDPFFIELDPWDFSLRHVKTLPFEPPYVIYQGNFHNNGTKYEVTVIFDKTAPPVVKFSEIIQS